MRHRDTHFLGITFDSSLCYFPGSGAPAELRAWIDSLNKGRRKRNAELERQLQSNGFETTLEEVAMRADPECAGLISPSLWWRRITRRPFKDAFDRFLGEDGACYVPRDEAEFVDAVARIRASEAFALAIAIVTLQVLR